MAHRSAKSYPLNLRLTADQLRRVDALAASTGETRSVVMRAALRAGLTALVADTSWFRHGRA